MRLGHSGAGRIRFAAKLPKAITHERRLMDSDALLARFAEEVAGLGAKRGPVLVQLPPSLAFDRAVAAAFFETAGKILGGRIACEPRQATWFTEEADALFVRHEVARVAADPAPVAGAGRPGGWSGLSYTRLHGAPRIYWSDYDAADIAGHATAVRGAPGESWTIYDNTAAGCATGNALALAELLRR